MLIGLALLGFGGVLRWITGLADSDSARLATLPVVRTLAELDNLPPGTELLLEGRARRALLSSDVPPPAARLGLLAWREERFNRREIVTAGHDVEHWTPVDTVCPTLAVELRGAETPVLVSGNYRLLGALTQFQADTPATRPSPRAGARGSWRFTGLRAGARVTVLARKTSAAIGDSLPMRASDLRPGTAADWSDADAALHRFGVGFSWRVLALGCLCALSGVAILFAGWWQRRRALHPRAS